MRHKYISVRITLAAFALAAMFLLSSCQTALGAGLLAWQLGLFDKDGDGNHQPSILTLTAVPDTVPAGGTAVLTVVAVDSDDDDTLEYNWTSNHGTLVSPTDAVTSWVAPTETTGTLYINILVSDGKDSVTGTLPVVVTLN